jgi:ATP-dependent helicase/nuclease subunit A
MVTNYYISRCLQLAEKGFGKVSPNPMVGAVIVCDDKVMIVDYKTNRPAAKTLGDVPNAYVKQLRSYKQLVSKIYPNKKVEAFILWTKTAKMMELDNI